MNKRRSKTEGIPRQRGEHKQLLAGGFILGEPPPQQKADCEEEHHRKSVATFYPLGATQCQFPPTIQNNWEGEVLRVFRLMSWPLLCLTQKCVCFPRKSWVSRFTLNCGEGSRSDLARETLYRLFHFFTASFLCSICRDDHDSSDRIHIKQI